MLSWSQKEDYFIIYHPCKENPFSALVFGNSLSVRVFQTVRVEHAELCEEVSQVL